MKKLNYLVFVFAIVSFMTSCSSDDNFTEEDVKIGEYTHGLFVLNEGNFGSGNSEVSFIDSFITEVTNNIYGKANDQSPLGDTAQSIAIYEDLAFVVVNNSNKIVVVDRHTFEYITEIEEGINNPRFMTFTNGKAYVTNWGDPTDNTDDFVAVIDLEKMNVSKTISLEFGVEKILANDKHVFVAHKGGYSQNNKLSVIDANTNTVAKLIEVGDVPNSLQFVDNDLWVLAGGNPSYADAGATDGKLVKIDLGSLEITKAFDFVETSPSHLEYDNGNLYYTVSTTDWSTFETESNVYAMKVNSEELPTESVFMTDRSFYGAAIKDGKYFGGDAKDYASEGSVVVYDLASGKELVELKVGISPSGFFFTE